MTQDVYIIIRGEHTQEGVTDEPVILKTRGSYCFRNGKHSLRYTDEKSGESCLAKFDEKSLSMHRKGGLYSDMYFEVGRHFEFPCVTEAGTLDFAVETKEIALVGTSDDRQIELEVFYDLFAGEQKVQESHVTISCVPYPIV